MAQYLVSQKYLSNTYLSNGTRASATGEFAARVRVCVCVCVCVRARARAQTQTPVCAALRTRICPRSACC